MDNGEEKDSVEMKQEERERIRVVMKVNWKMGAGYAMLYVVMCLFCDFVSYV